MKQLTSTIAVIFFLLSHSIGQATSKPDLKYLVHWSKQIRNDSNYCNYLIQYVETYGADTDICHIYLGDKENSARLNYCAWEVFRHTAQIKYLKIAEGWAKPLLKDTTNYRYSFMDTYANILYREGRSAEAIAMEQKACDMTPDTFFYAQIKKTMLKFLEKMKDGQPTW